MVDDEEPVEPVEPLAPLEPEPMPDDEALEPDGEALDDDVSLVPVPLGVVPTLPEAESVVLLAVVLGVLVEAVVSVVVVLDGEVDGVVVAVVVPGVVVDVVVVVFLSQPAATAVARAITAIAGISFFMGSPGQSVDRGEWRARGGRLHRRKLMHDTCHGVPTL